jgi:hypothetical protein
VDERQSAAVQAHAHPHGPASWTRPGAKRDTRHGSFVGVEAMARPRTTGARKSRAHVGLARRPCRAPEEATQGRAAAVQRPMPGRARLPRIGRRGPRRPWRRPARSHQVPHAWRTLDRREDARGPRATTRGRAPGSGCAVGTLAGSASGRRGSCGRGRYRGPAPCSLPAITVGERWDSIALTRAQRSASFRGCG